MELIVKQLLSKLIDTNPVQGKKVAAFFDTCDDLFFERSQRFFTQYHRLLSYLHKDWDYVIDCYNKLNADMVYHRIEFLQTGTYANNSFADVQRRIYENPEVMEYHMHGLALAQFFWQDQYYRFAFFADHLASHPCSRYLEIGPGHGLYIAEAMRQYGPACQYEGIDISPTSLEMTAKVLGDNAPGFICGDIMHMDEGNRYDFITAGEVVEHLEDPTAFMKKVHSLLADNGVFYMTTPANAPMIDHIHLFNNEEDITKLIDDCDFSIIRKAVMYAENMEAKKAIKHKVPLMFAAFLQKK